MKGNSYACGASVANGECQSGGHSALYGPDGEPFQRNHWWYLV